MNIKMDGVEKTQKDVATNGIEKLEKPSIESYIDQTKVQDDLERYFSVPSEQTGGRIKLDDGTVITSPDAKPRVMTKEEVLELRDHLSDLGVDPDEFFDGVAIEPDLEASSEMDFLDNFAKYTDPDLYTYATFPITGETLSVAGPNCLAYAYGVTENVNGTVFEEKPGPGHFAGVDSSDEINEVMASGSPMLISRVFENYMKMDFEALGKEFKKVDSEYQPKQGERMIALVTGANVYGGGPDFHYYVKGADGKWSHKPGVTDPTIFDNSGYRIDDPKTCDRGDYDNFVGYYVISDK